MEKAEQSRAEIIREGAEAIRRSNLMSDTFASIALEDIGACQYVIRKILGMDDLVVTEVKGQYRLLNMTSKDAILDAFAEDSEGRLINIEIQRRDTIDHARRTRYYGAMIDKSSLDKGVMYDKMPDVYIIYISETDIWEAGETVYTVNKTIGKSGKPYEDGSHVIFVNAEVDDGGEVSKMMSYFKKADPDDMSQGELSERVRYLKNDRGGYETMCEAAEKIYVKGIEIGIAEGIEQGEEAKAKKTAERLYKKGTDVEEIADILEVSAAEVSDWLGLQRA